MDSPHKTIGKKKTRIKELRFLWLLRIEKKKSASGQSRKNRKKNQRESCRKEPYETLETKGLWTGDRGRLTIPVWRNKQAETEKKK